MKIKKLRLFPSLIQILYLYVLTALLDYFSTLLGLLSQDGMEEGNAFVRNADHHFVLHKAMVVDFFYFSAFSLIAYIIYLAVSQWRKDIARMAVCLFFGYHIFERLIAAVVPNILYALHFYMP